MSRVGKQPINIKDVQVSQSNGSLIIKGKLGEMQLDVHPKMKIEIQDQELSVLRPDDSKESKSLHGLTRALIQNIVIGVSEGYSKTLDIVGVGYRAELKGKNLFINIGLSLIHISEPTRPY